MHSTGHGRSCSQGIPVNLRFHDWQIYCYATELQNIFLQHFFPGDLSTDLPLRSKFFMSRKTIFYIIFFSLLVVAFYVVLITVIPGFSKSKLPPISYVQPFSFTNQDGKIINERNVRGKIYLANYFFTTCRTVCPRMNTQVKKVYDHFKNEKDFLILSHTSDPRTDS